MNFLNEENRNNLVISDLQKLGKILYHENNYFKHTLEQKLMEKASAKPQTYFKKLFSLKWVWITAPATLLLFVMLAEASEYAGLEIKPYHYFKTQTLPAVSKQVKRVATTMAKKIETIATKPAEKKPINERMEMALSTAPSSSLIAFEPLTNQKKEQLIQEINAMLAKNQVSANLQPTFSAKQPANFQPQKPLLGEVKPNFDAQQQKKEPNYYILPVQNQPVTEPAKNINITKIQPAPPITAIEKTEALPPIETKSDDKPKTVCQNKTEIIITAENITEATEKTAYVINNLGLTITEKKINDAENIITMAVSLEQYDKLIQAVKNSALEFEEKVIVKQDNYSCNEILIAIYLREKPPLLEKVLPPPS